MLINSEVSQLGNGNRNISFPLERHSTSKPLGQNWFQLWVVYFSNRKTLTDRHVYKNIIDVKKSKHQVLRLSIASDLATGHY